MERSFRIQSLGYYGECVRESSCCGIDFTQFCFTQAEEKSKKMKHRENKSHNQRTVRRKIMTKSTIRCLSRHHNASHTIIDSPKEFVLLDKLGMERMKIFS